MRTPASIARHPIHPMLVPIPIGLWLFSFVCDLLFVFGTGVSLWFTLAFYTMIGGLIGAVLAAIPGFIDMLSLSGSRKRIALFHMTINLVVVALYAFNIGLRISGSEQNTVPVILSAIAVALLGVSGWLGGHMVYVYRVAVDAEER
ncbi:MAG TPA: DUF2231 domain-containing protein [Burkholderiales bacterium]|jgi:uncharacterized membrane protein|nr:DUF2231 domain-containing protein [Burkholderiales bacterium]